MAAKIKDGLFIGDAETSQSEDFINDNKISNLINLAGREVPNIWASHGLVYMTFNWDDRPDFRLGLTTYRNTGDREKSDFMADMVEFIDVSIRHGISVLLFSRNGTGRCVVAACAYLMMKYHWSFEKAFEFVYTKKPDINLNRGFVQQLFTFDKHLLLLRARPDQKQILLAQAKQQEQSDPTSILTMIASSVLTAEHFRRWREWSEVSADARQIDEADYDNDELVLVNGYVNSKVTITSLPGPFRANGLLPPKKTKLRFNEYKFEEDVNMFPTSPPDIRYTAPPRGVLKTANQKALDDDTKRRVTGNGLEAKRGEEKQPASSREMDRNSSSHRDRHLDDDDDVSDISSVDPLSSPKYEVMYGGVRERADERSAGQSRPSSAGAKHVQGQSHGLGSHASDVDDLYGYIGVPKTSLSSSEAKTTSYSSSMDKQQPTERVLAAEERIKKLAAGLGHSNGRSQSQAVRTSHERGIVEVDADYSQGQSIGTTASGGARSNSQSRERDRDRDLADTFSSNVSITSLGNASSSSGPSLYDLAHTRAGPQPSSSSSRSAAGNSRGSSNATAPLQRPSGGAGASRQTNDPLQYFELMQKEGVIRARYDVGAGADSVPSASGRSRRSAWGEDAGDPPNTNNSNNNHHSNNNNGQNSKIAPRFASPQLSRQQQQLADNQPRNVYRHGSPVQRTHRSGGASSTAPSQQRPTSQSSSNTQRGLAGSDPYGISSAAPGTTAAMFMQPTTASANRRGSNNSISSVYSAEDSLLSQASGRPQSTGPAAGPSTRTRISSSPMRPQSAGLSNTFSAPSQSQGVASAASSNGTKRFVSPVRRSTGGFSDQGSTGSNAPPQQQRVGTPTRGWRF